VIDVGSFRPPLKHKNIDASWMSIAGCLWLTFRTAVGTWKPDRIFIEQPIGAVKSYAQKEGGSQFKLDCIVGILLAACFDYREATTTFDDPIGPVGITLVPVRAWKGQLPKDVSTMRTKHAMGWSARPGLPHSRTDANMPHWFPKNEHEWDALGLAVYVNNKLNGRLRRM